MSRVEEAIQTALAATEDVPDDLRDAAFREVLRFELGSEGGAGRGEDDPGSEEQQRRDPKGVASTDGWEQEVISGCPPAHEALDGSRDQQAVWAVIELHSDGEEATVEAVRSAIKRAGETPSNRTYTSNTLRELTRNGHLRREKRTTGGGFKYLPSRKSLDVFDADDS